MAGAGMSGDDKGVGRVDVEIPASLDGQRVDRVLSMLTGVSRSRAAALVADGAVTVDGTLVQSRALSLRLGQRLEADVPADDEQGPHPDPSVPFNVVYEDEHLIVIDKPAGVVVHHGAGHSGGTLVDGLLARYDDLRALAEVPGVDPARPGIVHRLDKGTSGLMVVGRTPEAMASLSEQLKRHSAGRGYMALVAGRLADRSGVIDAPIGRSARRPDRMTVRVGGRPARTGYEVQRQYSVPIAASLVEVALETGRTHQVRVHMDAIGHPVIGDDRYGAALSRPAALVHVLGAGRLFLHAATLAVDHPADGSRRQWQAPLPADLREALKLLS
ncbi:MAG: RluA family pseudouridine synthase [Acidimicrobiales bacterium]